MSKFVFAVHNFLKRAEKERRLIVIFFCFGLFSLETLSTMNCALRYESLKPRANGRSCWPTTPALLDVTWL